MSVIFHYDETISYFFISAPSKRRKCKIYSRINLNQGSSAEAGLPLKAATTTTTTTTTTTEYDYMYDDMANDEGDDGFDNEIIEVDQVVGFCTQLPSTSSMNLNNLLLQDGTVLCQEFCFSVFTFDSNGTSTLQKQGE